jgi:ribose transport system substrate-binding protein
MSVKDENKAIPLAIAMNQLDRRGFLKGLAAMTAGATILAACSNSEADSESAAEGGDASLPFGRRLKAAFSNAGLANSWPAQGKAAVDQWAPWLGVDVTWFDGGLSVDVQRKAIDDMATKDWDFVAIQAFGIDTLVDPVKQMIAKGIPVIQMDTIIGTEDPGITTFLEPDNIAMGETVAKLLFDSLGGEGNVIMTQGALGHSGAQKRAQGFYKALETYPGITVLAEDTADWDVGKTAELWEGYLVKYPDIGAGFFHSDDMALAAANVVKNAGREAEIALGGIDAMPEAIQGVVDGRLLTTVRNSTVRIHTTALVIGAMVATGQVTDIPKLIRIDGPLVTQDIAPGLLFMEEILML